VTVVSVSRFKMKHALLMCRDAGVCALRRKFAYLSRQISDDFSAEQPLRQQVSAQMVNDFLLQHSN